MCSKSMIAGSILLAALVIPRFAGGASGPAVDDVGQTRVTLTNTSAQDGSVTGEIVNNLPHEVRDVQLLIRHVWHWNNEFRPGIDNPGTAAYYTVEKTIPPRGKVPFAYKADGLPKRADGRFETMVSVAGYAEVIRP